jgi:hypothetical protein
VSGRSGAGGAGVGEGGGGGGSLQRLQLSMVLLDFVVPAIERALWRIALAEALGVPESVIFLDSHPFSAEGHISVRLTCTAMPP